MLNNPSLNSGHDAKPETLQGNNIRPDEGISRRRFLKTGGAGIAAIAGTSLTVRQIMQNKAEHGPSSIERLVQNFPKRLEGAAQIYPYSLRGSNQGILFFSVDHRSDPWDTEKIAIDEEEACNENIARSLADLNARYPEYTLGTLCPEGLSPDLKQAVDDFLAGKTFPEPWQSEFEVRIQPFQHLIQNTSMDIACVDSRSLNAQALAKENQRIQEHNQNGRTEVTVQHRADFHDIQRQREDVMLDRLVHSQGKFKGLLLGKSHDTFNAWQRLNERLWHEKKAPTSGIFIVPEGVENARIGALEQFAQHRSRDT